MLRTPVAEHPVEYSPLFYLSANYNLRNTAWTYSREHDRCVTPYVHTRLDFPPVTLQFVKYTHVPTNETNISKHAVNRLEQCGTSEVT